MTNSLRTHRCGELRVEDVELSVTLNGWVAQNRNHGGVLFINLRDRSGTVQTLIEKGADAHLRALGEALNVESCVAIRGKVRRRPPTMINPAMTTGQIEVEIEELELLADCETLPFQMNDTSEAREELRQRYRFLDLRRPRMQRNMTIRHHTLFVIRQFLHNHGFYEIETPTLIRSTPEGARDLLVPSRQQPGYFYALPQSPQIYKQLLMCATFERYFQVARCYRDEDVRGDRQLEHTQIDIEMSFVDSNAILSLVERLMASVFKQVLSHELPLPFPRLSYDESRLRYGSDKPDIRYQGEITDCQVWATHSRVHIFTHALQNQQVVRAMRLPTCQLSRRELTELEELARTAGAAGMAWCHVQQSELKGGIGAHLNPLRKEITQQLNAIPGDMLLFIADSTPIVCKAFDAIRRHLIAHHKLPLREEYRNGILAEFGFAWIVDFPLFEWNDDLRQWEAAHHLFSMPHHKYIAELEKYPDRARGHIYDLVCNGLELASGSIRVHQLELQRRILTIAGIPTAEAEQRFGVLLRALRYGAPPHGGIAPGLDRLMMLLQGESSIREVIAFPKNSIGASALDESPAHVTPEQLKELGLIVKGTS